MLEQITLREWINNFNKGDYNSTDIETQCEAGWSNWFCRENELRDKLYKMAEIVKEIKNDLKHYIQDNLHEFLHHQYDFQIPLLKRIFAVMVCI